MIERMVIIFCFLTVLIYLKFQLCERLPENKLETYGARRHSKTFFQLLSFSIFSNIFPHSKVFIIILMNYLLNGRIEIIFEKVLGAEKENFFIFNLIKKGLKLCFL